MFVHSSIQRRGGGFQVSKKEKSGDYNVNTHPLGEHILTASFLCSKTPLRLLTKGDNNIADDTELYATGQTFLNRKEDVIGSVIGFIPFVGYITILLSEHPWLKQVMLGIMGVMVVLQRE